uniref:Conotoxin BtIIIA n=2 Tax=Conus betulinus TaxID=89764 RepID=M3A_CONBE|nr:RecName: Full=Conotoxin BtIIIA; AltName: Full=BeTXIa [Conus betulinus]
CCKQSCTTCMPCCW